MNKCIMVGCDLHDGSMVLQVAEGTERPVYKVFATEFLELMVDWLKEFAAHRKASTIMFAYEASSRGFGLYDTLTDFGIKCYVLAPTHLPQSTYRRKRKTDARDALIVLDELRAHVLAGKELPAVWIPNLQTRDDREPVRLRLELATQRTRIKNQIRNLAKRFQLRFPTWFSRSGDWSKRSIQWLHDLAAGEVGGFQQGARATLKALVGLYEELSRQLRELDGEIRKLAATERYAAPFRRLTRLTGIGTLTAMVFLTELGDLNRFSNRRQLAAYLGLVPASFESGERDDRKGRITRQGPSRVRQVLCQAAWTVIRCKEFWREKYGKLKRGSDTRSKIAVVGVMRRLAIWMWQVARSDSHDELIADYRADCDHVSQVAAASP